MIEAPPWQRQRPPYPAIQNPCQRTLKCPGQTRDNAIFITNLMSSFWPASWRLFRGSETPRPCPITTAKRSRPSPAAPWHCPPPHGSWSSTCCIWQRWTGLSSPSSSMGRHLPFTRRRRHAERRPLRPTLGRGRGYRWLVQPGPSLRQADTLTTDGLARVREVPCLLGAAVRGGERLRHREMPVSDEMMT